MSATPVPLPHWIGSFDSQGSPLLRIRVSGPFGEGQEFDAIIDTGFTGFLSMPLIKAFPLGLLLRGTTALTQADGSRSFKLTAGGQITVHGETRIGIAILEPSSTDLLIGIGFLRSFERALFVSSTDVRLVHESFLQTLAGGGVQSD